MIFHTVNLHHSTHSCWYCATPIDAKLWTFHFNATYYSELKSNCPHCERKLFIPLRSDEEVNHWKKRVAKNLESVVKK